MFASQNSRPKRWERSDFPAGLRVLVADGDVVFLNYVKNMLWECGYEARTTTKGREALEMLRKNKDDYDVVLCGDGMPDMDSFELLDILVVKTDIPVIMMSVSDEMSSAMKCIRHGAQYCLVKPVQLSELRNIWQHVLRKNMSDSGKLDLSAGGEIKESLPLGRLSDNSRDKMEGEETNHHLDRDSYQGKKRRFSWTEDLKAKFVNVVQELGVDRATPKTVLENMNDPRLTREIIASHLQKYRNSMKKQDNGNLERENNVDSQGIQRGLPNMTSTVPSYNNCRPSYITRSPLYHCHQGPSQQQNVQPPMTYPVRSVHPNPAWVVSHPQFDVNFQAFRSSQFGRITSFGNVAQPGPIASGSITPYSDPHLGSLKYGGMHDLEDGFSFHYDSFSQTYQTRLPESTIAAIQSSLSESQSSDILGESGQMTHTHRHTENNGQLNDPNHSENLDDKIQQMMQIKVEDQQQSTEQDGGYSNLWQNLDSSGIPVISTKPSFH